MKLLKIFRPINLLIIVIVELIVRYVLIQHFYEQIGLTLQQSTLSFVLMVGATVVIAAAGNLINDLADINIDKVNHPDKTTIDQIVGRPAALRLYTMLTALGVSMGVVSAVISNLWYLGLIFPIVAYVLYNYSMVYKRVVLVGNMAVAFLSGFVPIMIWLFELSAMFNNIMITSENLIVIKEMSYFVFGLGFFAFMTTLIREILKDVEDVDGDAEYGIRSLPMVLGLKKIRFVLFGLCLATAICLMYIQFVLLGNGYTMLSVILLTSSIPLVLTAFLSLKMRDRLFAKKLVLVLKNIMILGILSLLFV